jgi:hypothetical protein
MPIAIVPEKRWPFVLEADRKKPAEEQTTFSLKAMSRMERMKVKAAFEASQGAIGEQLTLEYGIVGWDNFRHPETGAPITFEKDKDGKPDKKNLEWINPDDWSELFDAIIGRQELTEPERKNSDSPAT